MKLHLGCGRKYIEGFKHVDLQDFDHIDYRTSVDDLNFAEDNSVTLIYVAHVLEHFGRNEYKNVLNTQKYIDYIENNIDNENIRNTLIKEMQYFINNQSNIVGGSVGSVGSVGMWQRGGFFMTCS